MNHLGSVYTKSQRQRCDNSAMTLTILFSIEISGVAPEWVCNPFSSDCFQREQNRKCHRRVVTALTLTLGVNEPLGKLNYGNGGIKANVETYSLFVFAVKL